MFKEFFSDLPDGPYWPTGKYLKRLGTLLDKDRARLAVDRGQELPTDTGRWFVPNGGSGTTITDAYDFEVYVRDASTTSSPIWQRGVRAGSILLLSPRITDTLDVSGLLTSTDLTTATGWKTTEEDDLIWLEIAFSSFLPVSAEIKSLSNGDNYGGGEIEYEPVDEDNSTLTTVRIPLAAIGPIGTDKLGVVQVYFRGPITLVSGFFTAYDSTGSNARNIPAYWRMP